MTGEPSRAHWTFTVLAFLTCLPVLQACSHSQGPSVQLERAGSGFEIQTVEGNFVAAAAVRFTAEPQVEGDQIVVRLEAEEAADLRSYFIKLTYDPALYDPLDVQPTGLLTAHLGLGMDAQAPASLDLAITNRPGEVYFGEVLVRCDQQPGFTGQGTLSNIRFAKRSFTMRSVSDPPVTDASQTEAEWNPYSNILSWAYYCQGDYDQNGEVNISDLTGIARFFGDVGPFDPRSARSVADGDGNGEIGIADVTPISLNFLRAVAGYDVYASLDPQDLPATNDAASLIAPLAHVPFADHVGRPATDRIAFAREFPGVDSESFFWVRPVDGELAGTPSTAQAAANYDWTIRCPSTHSTLEASINHISLASISGLPAILYMDCQEQQLAFQRALDASGIAWGSEAIVDLSANSHYASSMIEVQGHAAVCHHEAETGQVEYTRAGDLVGDTWSVPYIIDTTASGGWDCHLLLVHDHPAVCYADLAEAALLYARAEDPLGMSWGAPIPVADLGSSTAVAGSWSSPAMISDHPAIAYYHSGSQELRFIRATDPLGEAWGSAVVAANGTDVGRYCSLAAVHDAPAVSYLGDSGLAYARALDAVGDAWNTHQEIDNRFGAVDHLDTSLALIGGRPAISYYSGGSSADLLFVRAIDPPGEIWEAPQSIDSYNRVGRSSCLLAQEDRPTIAYLDESARQVMYAHSGADVNYPPIARLSVYPAPAAVGEDVTLDASLSYAQQDALEVFEWDLDGDGTYETNSGPGASQVSTYAAPGTYLLGVRVTDQHGLAAEDQVSLLVGTLGSAPIAALTANPPDIVLEEITHFSASDSTDDGTIELYEWDLEGDGDFETDTGNIAELDYEYAAEGIFNPAVRITDNIGLSDITSTSVNVGVLNERPVPILTATPNQGNPPFTVNLDGSASYDPDGTITTYEWDLDNDGLFEHNGGATATMQWLCEQHGDQRVRLRVTDNLQAKGTTWILIGSNQAPVAKLVASAYNGNAPYDVTLDCSASYDPDGSIAKWGIDLQNDGLYNAVSYGQPTSWSFTNIWNGLTKIRLTVKDNEGATSSIVTTVHANKGWHVRTIDPIGHTGMYNSLEIINGQPAIAYFEFYSSSLKFVRATDTYGYGPWAMPVNLGAIGPPSWGTNFGYVSLAWVNSTQPAIAFAGDLVNGSFFAVAKDSNGATWHPFVKSTKIEIIGQPVLGIIKQKPTLFYGDHYYGMNQATAKGYQGLQWNQPVPLSKYAGCISMTIVNGYPAMAYALTNSTYTSSVLKYSRATQSDGSKWGVGVVIDGSNDLGGAASLAIINGRPAVAYVVYVGSAQVGYEVRYKRADNQNGTSWTGAVKKIKQDGRTVLGLAEIDGRPAIGLVTCQGTDVMYYRANDAAGNSWPTGLVVDDLYTSTKVLIGIGPEGEMIEINDRPAMSYFDPAKGDLKYAVLE